jgi:hypothetical protein
MVMVTETAVAVVCSGPCDKQHCQVSDKYSKCEVYEHSSLCHLKNRTKKERKYIIKKNMNVLF